MPARELKASPLCRIISHKNERARPARRGHRMGSGRIPFRTIAILAGLAIWTSTARAQTVEDFYKGKTLTMVVSAGVGEGFDTNARLVAKHLGSHLPGNPTIIAKNMPGAGHVLAANYLFNDAPRDGTTICGIAPSIIIHQLL